MPLSIGREASRRLLEESLPHGKTVGVALQKNTGAENPLREELCDVGVIAKVVRMIRQGDSGVLVVVHGESRMTLKEAVQTEPYMKAAVERFPSKSPAAVKNLRESSGKLMALLPELPDEVEQRLKIIPVETADEVLKLAIEEPGAAPGSPGAGIAPADLSPARVGRDCGAGVSEEPREFNLRLAFGKWRSARGVCGTEISCVMKTHARSQEAVSSDENHGTFAVNVMVKIPIGSVTLTGDLQIPQDAAGLVLFAHGSGSSRQSPRNQAVARALRGAGSGTLLFDLLTRDEEAVDDRTGHLRFDIPFLAERLVAATRCVTSHEEAQHLPIGYFGASTGGAAALVAAAELGTQVKAVVSRGGRPDLAGDALPLVKAPTLLIVGGYDGEVLRLNEDAHEQLRCEKKLAVVPRATHLFEEPGAIEEVARLAAAWFQQHLGGQP